MKKMCGLALAFVTVVSSVATAQLVNGSFETGDLTGWTPYYAVSCKNWNVQSPWVVRHRNSDCSVWINNLGCSSDGNYAIRIQNSDPEVGWLQGVKQVVEGLTPNGQYILSMDGIIRSLRPGGDYLRLWGFTGNFADPIPLNTNPNDPNWVGCNPANFPQNAVLVGEWTQNTGQPGENWVTQSGVVTAGPGGRLTIFIDVQFDDPAWAGDIHVAIADNVQLVPVGPVNTATPTNTPTPSCDDTDADGVCDSNEAPNNTPPPGRSNIWVYDSDNDGLRDGAEDTNGDGVQSAGETSTRNRDSDGDQFRDSIEVLLGTNPLSANAGYADADADGLPDANDPCPNNRDCDGDRYGDGYEAGAFQSLAAANNAAQKPNLGDANNDQQLSNLDALVTQALFLGNANPTTPVFQPATYKGFRYLDTNSDGAISNVDALVINSFFLGNLPVMPLAF